MSISIVVQIILAIFKIYPKVETEIFNARIREMKKENRDALKKAIDEQDQRDLEIAIGSTNAGEVSNTPGSVVVDDLPGV